MHGQQNIKISPQCSDWLWRSPSILFNSYWGSVLRDKGKLLRYFSFKNMFLWEVFRFFAVFMP